MKNFDGYIPSIFTFKTPPGTMSWLVDPEKINADWYLQKGWPQFVQDNTHGDFLTYSYDGKSTFYVDYLQWTVAGRFLPAKLNVSRGMLKHLNAVSLQNISIICSTLFYVWSTCEGNYVCRRSGKGVRRRITNPSKPCSQDFFKVVLPQRLASKNLYVW